MPTLSMLVFMGFVATQPAGGSPDKVTSLDRKTGKTVTLEGLLQESPAGIIVSVGGKEKSRISAADIIKVELGDLPGLTADDKGNLFSLENEKDYEKAARGYAALATKSQQNDRVKRAMEFRELLALAKAVDAKEDAGFKANAPAVADRFAAFARANVKSWEVWPATRTAARLFAELGRHDQAAAQLKALAATPGLGAELKVEAKLAEADCLLRSTNASAGRIAVAALLNDSEVPATGPLRERLSIYDLWANASSDRLDESMAKIQAAIDAAKSPAARAFGFNARGELFLASRRPQEAIWEFLNVDVVYDQDRDELAKALRRLIDLFERRDEKDRADQCRERLRKIR